MKTSYKLIEHNVTQHGAVISVMEITSPSNWWDTLWRRKETKKVFEVFYPIKNTVKYFTNLVHYPSAKELSLKKWKIVKSLLEIEQMEQSKKETQQQIQQTADELQTDENLPSG